MAEILQYDRRIKLLVALPVATSFSEISVNTIEITQMRVQFKVEKSLGKDPNKAEVSISNLSAESRCKLSKTKNGKFILQAGYVQGTGQLFIGDIRQVDHIQDGPSWYTRLTSGDGERSFRFARVKESFKAGTPVADVISKLATASGLATGNLSLALTGLTTQYVNGYTSFGSVARELTRVLNSVGLDWSIQDGELQFLRTDQDVGLLIPDLTPDTGLIGSPEFNYDEKSKGFLLKAKCLLQPRIKPGGRVHITSERYKGDVKVKKVVHTGDTHGQEWYSELEALPIGGT